MSPESDIAIRFDHVGKLYRLGQVGTGTLSNDLNRWWQTRILHREDPYMIVGEINDRAHKGSSDYVWALRDIDFEIRQGEVVGIIGKNGAGKSTLLKLLSRVTAPTTGEIRARGRIASLLEVGTGFHQEMTGRENIFMNGSILGMTRAEINRKLDEIVDFAGVERYLDTPVKRYSSGMMVRLGFAVAAFLEPDIMVVDEVLAVGDAEFQKKAIGKMQDVSRGNGRTVLFVSHNMAAVRSLCQRGIILENGRLSYDGDVDDAVDRYLQDAVTSGIDLPLSEMPRAGKTSGSVRFTGIEFLNRDGEPIQPTCGAFLRIRVTFEARIPVGRGHMSLEIHDLHKRPIIYFSSQFTQAEQGFQPGEHSFTIDIEKLRLTEGDYRILLWSYFDGRVADFLDGTIPMSVDNGPFFAWGQNIPPHLRTSVLEDHTWQYDQP